MECIKKLKLDKLFLNYIFIKKLQQFFMVSNFKMHSAKINTGLFIWCLQKLARICLNFFFRKMMTGSKLLIELKFQTRVSREKFNKRIIFGTDVCDYQKQVSVSELCVIMALYCNTYWKWQYCKAKIRNKQKSCKRAAINYKSHNSHTWISQFKIEKKNCVFPEAISFMFKLFQLCYKS